jgi:serine/threonine protein kinase
MTHPTSPLDGPRRERFGPYIVQTKIGAGGMATVYRAQHINGQNPIALKVLAIHLAGHEDVRRRFEREARTLIQFNHPHILPVFDFGEDQGTPYIALKLLSGRSLDDLLHHAPLPIPQIGRLTRQIASALDYAHARGIVHRDIKPANILLDDENTPYLADFGVAYLTESDPGARLTQAGSFVGTVAYASPEQCRGEVLDRPSDVYSLAVVVFQMATGRLPFEAPSSLAVIKMHLHAPPPNPLAFNPALPIELYHVLVKALAKLPENRYPSAMKFSEAVDAALGQHALPAAEGIDADEDAWLYGDLSPVLPDDDRVIPHSLAWDDQTTRSSSDMPVFEATPAYEDVAAGFDNADFDFDAAADFVDFADFQPPAEADFVDAASDDFPSAADVLLGVADSARAARRQPQPLIRPLTAEHGRACQPAKTRPPQRRILAYVVIVIALVTIAAGGMIIVRTLTESESTIALDAVYQSPAFGLTFDYPAGWTITEGEGAILSAQPTGTLYLSDQPVAPGETDGAPALTIAIQRIDPAAIYGIPGTCTSQITRGPDSTFTCVASQGYTTPTYSAFNTSFVTGGVTLPGTLPPTRSSPPLILLPAHNEPTWIAILIVQWDGFADARDLLDRVAGSVR